MRQAYAALLWLYPAEHRDLFAAEMLDTFEQAAKDWRARGTLAYWCFAAWELTGLLHALPMEWFAKRAAGEEYLHSCSRLQRRRKLPTKEAEMKRLLERLVRKMEFAIAHHDFPKARFYSAAECKTRKKLERLLARRNGSQT